MSRLIGGDSELRNSNSDVLRAAMVRMNRALRHQDLTTTESLTSNCVQIQTREPEA